MRTVPALDRGLQILEHIALQETPVKVAEMAASLGIPRSAAYELVHTLKSRGYITQDGDGLVSLGSRLFALGSRYGQTLDLTHVAQEIASQVRNLSNETVQVGTLDGRHVLYIARADPSRMVRLVSAVGRRLPAHATAIGKAMLAQLDPAELDARIAGVELEPFTPQSITDHDRLRAVLADVRREGVARDDRESNPEVRCVAAPVLDASNHCVAAISISVPTERMTEDHALELTGVVREAAAEFSARLGHLAARPLTTTDERTDA
ncbi:IclR family transcriptional regulator [Micromonospora sp. NPDC005113]